MSFQIMDIIVYSHDDRKRILQMRPGKTNIITGDSKTGKTALISIIDYCLGSSNCEVPAGPIRRASSWLGLRLQLLSGQVFVARKVPDQNHDSNAEVLYIIGDEVNIPEASELHATTNESTLRSLLAEAAGIGSYIHEPPAGQTRVPLAASIRHALAFSFQPQFEINQPKHLFHEQSNNFVAQAIKDTLPYFLGAVDEDIMVLRSQLQQLRKKLKDHERRLTELESVKGYGISKTSSLLSEARELGLIDFTEKPKAWDEAAKLLSQIVESPVDAQVERIELGEGGDELDNLMQERNHLEEGLRRVKNELIAAKALMQNESGYSHEIGEQVARLQSIEVLSPPADMHCCPLCEQPLEDKIPPAAAIIDAVNQASQQLNRVTKYSPQLQSVIDELEQKVNSLKQQLKENRESLESVRTSKERLTEVRDASARRAYIIGRATLFLESLPEVEDTNVLREKIQTLSSEIEEIEAKVSDELTHQKLESFLNIIGKKMTEWAQQLQLEHSEQGLRLDLRGLTVVADTDEGPLPMAKMGSGENWVGYHIVSHLALHNWFVRKQRPIPRFLFLDQPSQIYFPDDLGIDGSMAQIPSNDRQAVARMFKVIVDAVEELAPDFQVLITEHAEVAEEWYEEAVVDCWKHGKKLIPEDWPQVGLTSSQEEQINREE